VRKKNLIERAYGMDVLCMGGNDWWYHNRDHMDIQMVREFAKLGTVLYVNSIVMQKPNIAQSRKFFQKLMRKAKSILRGLKDSGQGFWVYSPFSLPVHHIAWLRPLNAMLLRAQLWLVTHRLGMRNPIIWVACPAVCDAVLKLKKNRLVYQRTDRYEDYPNVDADIIMQYDRKMKANADLVIFVNEKLYQAEREQCKKKAIFLDHGVDYEMFSKAENSKTKPSEMMAITEPVVGYFGSIDPHSFDIAFVERVADLLPQISFVFIGNASGDMSGLKKRNNVWLLGYKPYERIPDYGKCFDVAILPLPQNRWVEAINPIKLKNYLALGKPVVSTLYPLLQNYLDIVLTARTPEEFAECIESALAQDNPERIADRKKRVKTASWHSKAQLVREELFGKDADLQG